MCKITKYAYIPDFTSLVNSFICKMLHIKLEPKMNYLFFLDMKPCLSSQQF